MLILKQLKTLQHVTIINQIIIREFVVSLLKSLNLKFNYQRLKVVMKGLQDISPGLQLIHIQTASVV
jgi:hypothetical protein